MHTTSHAQVAIHQNNIRKKIRRSASEWRSIISDYKMSGLTQREYCHHRGVAYSSFTTWHLKLKKLESVLPADESRPPLFVEMTTDNPSLTSTSNDWDVELAFANGTVLRLKQNQG